MILTYTDFREHLADYMEHVCDSREVVRVTRRNARSVVVMAEDEYESIMETVHLLRSPANARRLSEATADIAAGNVVKRDDV
jgi:antitoxin YefM